MGWLFSIPVCGVSKNQYLGWKYSMISRVRCTTEFAYAICLTPTVFAALYSVQGGLVQSTSKEPGSYAAL